MFLYVFPVNLYNPLDLFFLFSLVTLKSRSEVLCVSQSFSTQAGAECEVEGTRHAVMWVERFKVLY